MKTLLVLSALTFSPLAAADVLSCHGTEPFWNLTVSGESIVLDNPNSEEEGQKTVYPTVPEKTASGYESDFVRVYNTINTKTGAAVNVNLLKGECSDGMNDKTFPYSVIFQDGQMVLFGCCTY